MALLLRKTEDPATSRRVARLDALLVDAVLHICAHGYAAECRAIIDVLRSAREIRFLFAIFSKSKEPDRLSLQRVGDPLLVLVV